MFFSSVSLQDWDSPGTISLYPVQTGFSDSFSTIVTASCFTLVEFCWCWRERSSSRKVPLSVFTMFGDLESSAITCSTKKKQYYEIRGHLWCEKSTRTVELRSWISIPTELYYQWKSREKVGKKCPRKLRQSKELIIKHSKRPFSLTGNFY